MEYVVLPAIGDIGRPRLLGLTLVERALKVLARGGLTALGESPSAGRIPLVLYPAELVAPPVVGGQLAGIDVNSEDVIAVTFEGAKRSVVIVGPDARAGFDSGAITAELLASLTSEANISKTIVGPVVSAVDRATAVSAKKMLLKALRKPIDGLVSRTLNRPVSIAISSVLASTPMTPNAISIVTFLFALVAIGLMATSHFILGALVMHFSSVLDGCDGEIARLKYQSSKLGAWLDTLFDDSSNHLFGLAVGYGLYRYRGMDGRGALLLGLSAAGFFLAIPTVATVYRRMIKTGTFDAGAVGWAENPHESAFRKFVGRYLVPLVKRDAYLFLFLIFTIVGLTEVIPFLYFGGAVGAFIGVVRGNSDTRP